MNWNEFQSANAGQYDKVGMSGAWKHYKDASGIISGTPRSQTAKSNYLKGLEKVERHLNGLING